MNTRCRPGDLALVIKGLYTGCVVTVIRLADEGLLRELRITDRPCWLTDKWLDWDETLDGVHWPIAPDTSLLPIRPEPDPCEIEHEEPVGALQT